MSEQHRALAQRAFDLLNSRDYKALGEVYADDFSLRGDVDLDGLQSYVDYFKSNAATLTDLQITLDDVVSEGDTVAVKFGARGTLNDKSSGSGGPVTVKSLAMGSVRDGKFAELHVLSNTS